MYRNKKVISMTNLEFANQFKNFQKKENYWCNFHPVAKLVFCMSLAFMTMISFKWQVGLGVFILASVIALQTPIAKKLFTTVGIMFLLGCTLTVGVRIYVNLDAEGPIAFFAFGTPIPLAAIIACLDLVFMIEGFLSIFLVFFLTTEMRDLCYSLEELGLPSTATFILLSTFSCITSIKEKLNNVRESQRARGIETEGNAIDRIKAILPVLFPVIISAMTSVEDKTLAMNARAFASPCKHSFLRKIAPATSLEKAIAGSALVFSIIGAVVFKIYL